MIEQLPILTRFRTKDSNKLLTSFFVSSLHAVAYWLPIGENLAKESQYKEIVERPIPSTGFISQTPDIVYSPLLVLNRARPKRPKCDEVLDGYSIKLISSLNSKDLPSSVLLNSYLGLKLGYLSQHLSNESGGDSSLKFRLLTKVELKVSNLNISS